MRALALALALVSTPALADERRVVPIGDVLDSLSLDQRDNVRLAKLSAPINRKIYLVERLSLPSGTELEWQSSRGAFCSESRGHFDSDGIESGLCLADRDGDGRMETASGYGIVRPVQLKEPAPFTTRVGTVFSPSDVIKRIVYLGGTSTEARFSYREFTREGLARPAFTEDLTVPLQSFPVQMTLKGVAFTIHGQSSAGLDVTVPDRLPS
ncbi:hypothetical protein BWQ93_05945 [Sphingopyxis sp. QXT-31]|uniref:hypothetical protein n=1 Tax=Sphingopyxis sp. QXT-31 TaxID=1357916 RepID=UPI0009792C11|nr:hypothetical protein [Sphingopyxis sp. QXT-31]APZ98072.1 hypothetical protein BWQ93_05945 [Sphingopyxis sp. QXT-31]